MNTFTLLRHAIWALFYIPVLLMKFMWSLIRSDEQAIDILANEVPLIVFLITPIAYIMCMIIALVTLLNSGGISKRIFEIGVFVFCVGWIAMTLLLTLQPRDTRMIQATSIQYYLLFVAFLQTLLWAMGPENPKNEPSSVLILFMATTVAYVNEKLIKPFIESHEIIEKDKRLYTVPITETASSSE